MHFRVMGVVLMATDRGPRISANKLGEYMVASFVRKRGIIKDQKRPPTALSARYAGLASPVLEFLTRRDTQPLHQAAATLSQQRGTTAWKESDRQSSIKALAALAGLAESLLDPQWTFVAPPTKPRKLLISGVEVSVQPHALVHGTKAGKPVLGAIRFHFIQDEESALEKRGSEHVASLLYRWCTELPAPGRLPHPAFCVAVDVFSGTITTAPVRQTKRMENIEAACEEIALRWPTL